MKEVNEILVEELKVAEDRVNEDLTMNDVDHWDSLSHMNLIVSLEEKFSIELSGDEIADMTTFNNIRAVIKKHLA